MDHTFELTRIYTITDENIADLLTAAFEGGINHWCGSAEIKYNEDGTMFGVPEKRYSEITYASDVIGPGGRLIFTDIENSGDGPWELSRMRFIEGVKLEMERSGFYSIEELMDNHDAETADCIVQYALFGEIVYG